MAGLAPDARNIDRRNKKCPRSSEARTIGLIVTVFFMGLVAEDHTKHAVAGDLVSVPIRWCALKGSPAVTDPRIDGMKFLPGGTPITTDMVLLNRLQRINEDIYR